MPISSLISKRSPPRRNFCLTRNVLINTSKNKRQIHITKGEKPRYHLHSMNLSFFRSYAIVGLSSMIFYLRWLAAPPILWAKTTENQFSTFLLYRFFKSASTGNNPHLNNQLPISLITFSGYIFSYCHFSFYPNFYSKVLNC